MGIHIFDASSFVLLNRAYPPDVFGPIWAKITEMAARGEIRSHRQVRRELLDGAPDDPARIWAKANKGVFVEPDGAQQEVLKAILERFPDLANAMKQKEHADPWCVAYARVLRDAGEDCCLVNEEKLAGTGSYRIPNVCREFDVKYTRIVGFFRAAGIKWE